MTESSMCCRESVSTSCTSGERSAGAVCARQTLVMLAEPITAQAINTLKHHWLKRLSFIATYFNSNVLSVKYFLVNREGALHARLLVLSLSFPPNKRRGNGR